MKLFKDIRYYLNEHGLVNLVRRVPDRLLRVVRPILYRTRKRTPETSGLTPVSFFTCPGLPSRVNLILQHDTSYADHAMVLAITAAVCWERVLRIISSPPVNANRFYRLLTSTGLTLKPRVEIISYEPDMANAEIDTSDNDIFFTDSLLAATRILGSINERNIICIIWQEVSDPHAAEHFGHKCVEVMKSQNIRFIVSGKQYYERLIAEGHDNIHKNGIWIERSDNYAGYNKVIEYLTGIPARGNTNVHS